MLTEILLGSLEDDTCYGLVIYLYDREHPFIIAGNCYVAKDMIVVETFDALTQYFDPYRIENMSVEYICEGEAEDWPSLCHEWWLKKQLDIHSNG